ncbi:MAG: DNA modification methylase [Planctomycetes bacterium]|nr:DNA modification methylase [Planctomycetota bacterium]
MDHRKVSGLAIRRVALDSLHLDPANARSHNDRNLDAIKSSLSRFGQAEPLVVLKGEGRVIGGNGRLVAMKALGWKECDVVELELSAIDAASLGIALNRTAELAEWNDSALAEILKTLRTEDALDGVGFDAHEIDELLAELDGATPRIVEDEGPEPPPVNPVARRGDLWTLGDHRLLCGDSTSAEDLARLMAGEKATLFATDPPYCVDYTGNDRPIHDGKSSGKDWSHVYREVDIEDLGKFLDGVFTAALPHLAERTPIYVWHAHVQQPTIAGAFERHGLLLHQVVVWVKPCAVFGHSYFRWRHEPCAFGWVQGKKPEHGVAQHDTVWDADWEGKSRVVGNEHPTQKPTRLFELPMELHTKAGDVVLETFSGSGSQLVAAEKLKRRCRAMEISPAFVDVAIRRWQKASGKQALLDGKPYEDVKRERGVA